MDIKSKKTAPWKIWRGPLDSLWWTAQGLLEEVASSACRLEHAAADAGDLASGEIAYGLHFAFRSEDLPVRRNP